MVHRLSLPVFFMVAKQDLLARPWRVKALFEACGSHDKSFFLVEGDHCTQRDSLTLRKAANFIFKRWVLDNYRRNPDTSQLEGGNVLTEDDRTFGSPLGETLKQKSTSIELHNLGTSNLSSILAQAHQEYKESNPHSPQHLVLGQVTVDWPSVTILKRDFTRKPDVELLQSGVQPFDELQREITDIKEKKEVRKIIRRPLNVCINARPEE
jgi:hypothetical protein